MTISAPPRTWLVKYDTFAVRAPPVPRVTLLSRVSSRTRRTTLDLPRPPWVSGSRGRCSRHVRVALGLARSPVPSARTGQPAPRDTKAKGTRDSLTPQAYPPQSSQGGAAPTRSVYSLSLRRSQTSARTTPRCTLCVCPQHGPRGPCRRPRGGRVVVACAAHSPPPPLGSHASNALKLTHSRGALPRPAPAVPASLLADDVA